MGRSSNSGRESLHFEQLFVNEYGITEYSQSRSQWLRNSLRVHRSAWWLEGIKRILEAWYSPSDYPTSLGNSSRTLPETLQSLVYIGGRIWRAEDWLGHESGPAPFESFMYLQLLTHAPVSNPTHPGLGCNCFLVLLVPHCGKWSFRRNKDGIFDCLFVDTVVALFAGIMIRNIGDDSYFFILSSVKFAMYR